MPQTHTIRPTAVALAAAAWAALASTAIAQTAPAAAAAPASAAAGSAAAQARKAEATQQVIVTANKITTLASKTPLALSVVGSEALKSEGVIDARSLQELSPSVQIGQEAGRLQINIRGVMSINNTERGDPSNAFNVDGLYIGRPESQLASFLDVERIEVLRGPQGTLYGRNATGGAINIISAKPGNRFGGKASVEFGNYDARRVEAALNVPVNDLLKLRVAVGANKRDSYLLGPEGIGLEDQDDVAARVHGLLTFSPATSWLLTAEYGKINSNGFTPVPMKNFYAGTPKGGNANWYNDLLNPVWIGSNDEAKRVVDPFYAKPTFRFNENTVLRSEFRHVFGAAELVYQAGYVDSELANTFVSPFNGNPFLGEIKNGTSKQLSHEVRLQSAKAGPWTWVLGAYLFDEEITRDIQYNTFINPNFTFRLKFQPTVENKAQAVFGQSTFALTDALRLVTGLRYSKDKKSARDAFNGGGLTIPVSPFDRTANFDETTYRVGLDWDLSKDTFVYGSLSSGYKAGGFNTDLFSAAYSPEKLAALEVGVKTSLMDNRVQVSASAFGYDYKDLQLTSTVCTTSAAGITSCGSRTANASKATIQGLEAEGRWRVVDNGMLNFGLSLIRSKFGDYKPVNRPPAAPNVVIDYQGQQLDRVPESTLRLGYTHTVELGNGSALEFNAALRRNSGYLLSSYGDDYATRYEQPAFTKYDARVTWRSADDKYSVQAFVKNLTDEITVETRQPGSLNIGEPRTFGVRLNTTF